MNVLDTASGVTEASLERPKRGWCWPLILRVALRDFAAGLRGFAIFSRLHRARRRGDHRGRLGFAIAG